MTEERSSRTKTEGTCSCCGGVFGKSAMTRHLESCDKRNDVSGKAKPALLYHLLIEGRGATVYWVHAEMESSATLEDLDYFLRRIWLECCGHMSQFTIGGKIFASWGPDGDMDAEGMDIDLAVILRPQAKFYHEYDMGTTTALQLKVVGVREGTPPAKTVRLLARNIAPDYPCHFCSNPATQLCPVCVWEVGQNAMVCDLCRDKHVCEDSAGIDFLPVVNSPRVGMCCYHGEGKNP